MLRVIPTPTRFPANILCVLTFYAKCVMPMEVIHEPIFFTAGGELLTEKTDILTYCGEINLIHDYTLWYYRSS